MGHSRKKLDLIGQRFGRLTVIAPAENVGNRTAWLCPCDCGNDVVVKTYHLRSGHTASCGCQESGVANLTYVEGTCIEMLRAKTRRSNNTSGVPGVDWLSSKGRWRATIGFKGKRYYLGCFHNFDEAVSARKRAEEDLHDRFVREYAAVE